MKIKEDTDRVSKILHAVFEEKLSSITATDDGEGYVFFHLNGKIVFDKNNWGMLWIRDCGLFKDIMSYSRLLSVPEIDVEFYFMDYLNNKYSDVIGENTIMLLNTDYCDEL